MWLHHLFRPLTNDTILMHIEYYYINYSWLTTFARWNSFTAASFCLFFFSMVHHYYCIPPIYLPHKTFRFCLALFSFWKQFGNNFRAPTIYMFASVQSKKFQLNFLNFYTLLHIFSYVFLNSSRTFLWFIS